MEKQTNDLGGIIYTNYGKVIKQGEQFVSEHAVGLIISGTLRIVDGDRNTVFNAGDIILFRKNCLAKFFKQPANGGYFKAITVILDHAKLIDFNKEQHPGTHQPVATDAVLSLGHDPLLTAYFNSLAGYFHEPITRELIDYKKQELIHLLVRKDRLFKDILFDFALPGKIDLEFFMRRNFKYNIGLDKFAFLTGRSLATFKRDFGRIFNMPPSRWLQQQRLKEAWYLMDEKRLKPSEVYLEVGFESLPHFSHAFKQFFGKTPSTILQQQADHSS